MKLLPERYHSVVDLIEGTMPEARLNTCRYFVVSGHDVWRSIVGYMNGACICMGADDYIDLTYTESTA